MTRQWPDGSAFIPEVSDEFGGEHPLTGYHRGIDLIGFTWNRAADDGVVVMAGPNGTAGYEVRILHDDGYQTRYLHNAAGTIRVYVGQRVKRGDVLGAMGDTGYVNGVHLHFEVIAPDGTRIDPRLYIAAGALAGGGATAFTPATPATYPTEEIMYLKPTSGTDMSREGNTYADDGPARSWRGLTNLESVFVEAEVAAGRARIYGISGIDMDAMMALRGVAEQPEVTPIPWGEKGERLVGLGATTGRVMFPGSEGFRGGWHYPPVSAR